MLKSSGIWLSVLLVMGAILIGPKALAERIFWTALSTGAVLEINRLLRENR